MFNPAILGKAKRVKELMKQVPAPTAIFETVEDRENGAGTYIFNAKFANKEDAVKFMELCRLSAELEKYIEGG